MCSSSAPNSELISSVTWNDVRLATASDPLMTLLLETIENGFPDNRSDLQPDLKQYHQYRASLTTLDGFILYQGQFSIVTIISIHEKNSEFGAQVCEVFI